MQITKKQLKQLISEEAEKLSEDTAKLNKLVEGYVAGYGGNDDAVPKEALIDLLEVLEEDTIPRYAFDQLVESMNDQKVSELLSEVLETEE